MKLSIIFVDDDPNILSGLRRMLRGMRKEWHMDFAPGGRQALDMMAKHHFDVVISDMRMPEMDGAELLAKVKQAFPHMVRIILSGHSEKENILKTVQVAHRYLAKPCDPETIIDTIKGVCILRDLLPETTLKNFIHQLESLPSLPTLYSRLVGALKDPDIPLKKVGDIISRDVGMTSKLLKLVNSAFFGIGRKISDPGYAVQLLGLEAIRALVLTVEIFTIFNDAASSSLDLENLLHHSMKVAGLSKSLAESLENSQQVADDAFFAGMLHDLGKLVLASYQPEKYRTVVEMTAETDVSFSTAETEAFSTSHAEAGAHLLCLWGLPLDLVRSVAFHHNPLLSADPDALPLMAVAIADELVNAAEKGRPFEACCTEDIQSYIEIRGLGETVGHWKKIAANFEKIED